MNDDVIEALKLAKSYIEGEATWTKGALARTEKGYVREFFSPAATCFCAYGATLKASQPRVESQSEIIANNLLTEIMNKYLNKATPKGWASFIFYNDANDTIQIDVVNLFDDAIKLAIKDKDKDKESDSTKGSANCS